MSRREPVRHTCPDIDNCIKWLKRAKENIENAYTLVDGINDLANHENNGSISDLTTDIKSSLLEALDLIDFDRTLEELRESNSALRDWGHELVKEIENLENN